MPLRAAVRASKPLLQALAEMHGLNAAAALDRHGLAGRIEALLPQTQCTRCGYPDCAHYAQAIAAQQAGIDQCPPGGQEGVHRLAALTEQPARALNPAHGHEGPRFLAVIDENWCIGCTLCIDACPVDAILGASKRMHTVLAAHCTGCELCLPACPVDCIALVNASGARTGWAAWSEEQADNAARRHARHRQRLMPAAPAPPADTPAPAHASEDKKATIAAVLARARALRASR